MIGKAKRPLLFCGTGQEVPMPYFHKKSAWMDAAVFRRWFEVVFVPEVVGDSDRHIVLFDGQHGHARPFRESP